jgi:transcriptional regulator with XRE-family HTH domain
VLSISVGSFMPTSRLSLFGPEMSISETHIRLYYKLFVSLTLLQEKCSILAVPINPSDKSVYVNFGALVSKWRKKRHKSQEALAAELGLSRTSITNIERGRQHVQLHTLFALARILNIEPSDLLPSEAKDAPSNLLSAKETTWLTTVTARKAETPDAYVPRDRQKSLGTAQKKQG